MFEESLKGWGNCVRWSPEGKSLTILAQGNTIHCISLKKGGEIDKHKKGQITNLPLTKCFYDGEDTLIATGYDSVPFKFKLSSNNW